MPSLPNKSVKGAAFKKWAVESIDKLIDYLSSTYIQVGHGLKINRTPSGLVIELAKKEAPTMNNATGGGSSGSVIGFPDFTNGSPTDTSSHQVTGGDVWIGISATVNTSNTGSGGWAQLIISESAYGTALYTPTVVQYEGSNIAVAGSILVPVRNGLFYRIQVSGSVVVTATVYPLIQ